MFDFSKELKERISLTQVLDYYYNLGQGVRSSGGIKYHCPFHQDKDPSLLVNEEEHRFYCFGCQKSGDIFNVVQDREGVSFSDAIDILCKRYNISKPEYKGEASLGYRYITILSYVADLYNQCNAAYDGKGYKLWAERGFDKDFVDKYKLGICYDVNKPGGLLVTLKDKFGDFPYLKYNIVDKDGNSPFLNRLTIPICNNNGKVVSFTARTIVNDTNKYKLMRTNEFYKKQDNLFLFNKCFRSKKIIIVEGHMDALSLHKAGFPYAVALAGCKLSPQQSLLLKDMKVTLALDSDNAGVEATKKILLEYPEVDFNVVKYKPGAKDFNDILVSGEELTIETISDAEFIAHYLINNFNKYDACDKFVDYLSFKYKHCKKFEQHLKAGSNFYGISNAVKYLNKELDMAFDLMEVIDKVYG